MRHHHLFPLCVLVSTASVAGQAGRFMQLQAPAVLGQTALFAMRHPSSIAGNLYLFLWSPPFAGATSVAVPGFTVHGLARVNPADITLATLGILDSSGVTPSYSVPVPNAASLVGYAFDLQTADIDATSKWTFADDDLEIVLAARPLPSANMVAIPAGSFQMGSTATGGTAIPVHTVTVTRPFWMGKYEVTQADYQAVMATNPSYFQGHPYRPVETVSWADANNYCAVLTDREEAAGRLPSGYVYRLPTEAEWEYACRAGTTTEFHFGPVPCGTVGCCQYMNYTPGCNGWTYQVGAFAPNAWGLYDMHGNVAEWCLDSWDAVTGYSSSSSLADPHSRIGALRVLRGGSWTGIELFSRSAYRGNATPSFTRNDIGFRVVLAPPVGRNPTLVPIAAGSFQMGGPYGGVGGPIHTVTISRPFWMGKYEVTDAEWNSVMGSFSSLPHSWPASVSWDDAIAYCQQLTANERAAGHVPQGYEYRLPTEAEWEYCCRAGTTGDYGIPNFSCDTANFWGYGSPGLFLCRQLPFLFEGGTFPSNAWGICDMHGSLQEWCLDSAGPLLAYDPSHQFDPWNTLGAFRIVRGGHYGSFSDVCMSGTRRTGDPATPTWTGFRVVLAPEASSLTRVAVPDMVAIAPGTFQMGSPVTPLGVAPYYNGASAQPVHSVTITRPFWVGKFEVTQWQYQVVMGSNPSYFQGASYPNSSAQPVESVSWNDAMAYCAALTAQEAAAGRLPSGYQYRLPTEAEWEYCCRAGTTTEFHYGPSLVCGQANFSYSYHSNSSCNSGSTAVVGSYVPNAWGLFDMHGNVWEWCLDAWDGSANYPSSAVVDPFVSGSSSGSYRVVRGGSWSYNSDRCQSAVRNYDFPADTRGSLGFRVVCAPVLTP